MQVKIEDIVTPLANEIADLKVKLALANATIAAYERGEEEE